MKGMTDTPPEIQRKMIDVYRRMSPGQKWEQVRQMYADARMLHAGGVLLRNPRATPREILDDWFRRNLGVDPPPSARSVREVSKMQNLADLRAVLRALDGLGIPYALGGSMASSIHGISRSTRDADITVEAFPGKEHQLIAALGPKQYAPLSMIQDAMRRRASFNILNEDTGFKVDVFICKDIGFEREAMNRRILFRPPTQPDEPFFIHTAEDVLLFKLRWYRLGNEVSEQQWQDVINVLQVQSGKLDDAYLDRWAAELKVTDLLARARQESRLE